MTFRYTLGALFLATAIAAGSAAVIRIGGVALAVFVFMLFSGICVLIRSDWADTIKERTFLILLGLGLIAAALFWFLMPVVH